MLFQTPVSQEKPWSSLGHADPTYMSGVLTLLSPPQTASECPLQQRLWNAPRPLHHHPHLKKTSLHHWHGSDIKTIKLSLWNSFLQTSVLEEPNTQRQFSGKRARRTPGPWQVAAGRKEAGLSTGQRSAPVWGTTTTKQQKEIPQSSACSDFVSRSFLLLSWRVWQS